MISTLLARTASRLRAWTISPSRMSSERRTRTARLVTGSLTVVVGRSSFRLSDPSVTDGRGGRGLDGPELVG